MDSLITGADFCLGNPGSIDLGDPAADCAPEPAPSGRRVNAGCCGDTAEATSKAGASHRDVCPAP